MPSVRAFRTTWRTRSGRARALASRLDWASAVTARSVPGEITDATVRTSTSVASGTGRGTSSTSTGPPASGCTTCFTWFPRSRSAARGRVLAGRGRAQAACCQLVLICTGSTVVTRQTRTGAATVRAEPRGDLAGLGGRA